VVGFILIMLSVSATMMPAETNGLNQLPKRLYPHGTSVMAALQPLSGAIGVSVFISLLNSKQASYLQTVDDPTSAASISQAMVVATEHVYFIIFIISLITVGLSFVVYRARPIEEKDVTHNDYDINKDESISK